ncbi:MAG: nucleotidyl transferase AbiEii/AbiGii toxin family protein [Bacteroidales bacterium]
MLYINTVTEGVHELILSLQQKSDLRDFFLVGGTGLALQIGHRRSDDIDLFSLQGFDVDYMQKLLESEYNYQTDHSAKNTLKGVISGIKVDLITHPYRMILPVATTGSIRLASKEDISAMKVNAIANDGTRSKDFIDIYFLLEEMDINTLLHNFSLKYDLRNSFHALKSIQYFDDVDLNEWPELIREKDLTWDRITSRIEDACRKYHNQIREN